MTDNINWESKYYKVQCNNEKMLTTINKALNDIKEYQGYPEKVGAGIGTLKAIKRMLEEVL